MMVLLRFLFTPSLEGCSWATTSALGRGLSSRELLSLNCKEPLGPEVARKPAISERGQSATEKKDGIRGIQSLHIKSICHVESEYQIGETQILAM